LDGYHVTATIQLFGHPAHFGIGFTDYDGRALSSTALPEIPPIFSDINFGFYMLDSGIHGDGSLSSFTLAPPEPGGFVMVLFGATAVLIPRRRQLLRAVLPACLGAALVATAAQARPITFNFKGVVDNVVDWTYTIYPEYVNYGSLLSGQFTFESATPASPVSTWTNEFSNAVLSIEGQIGTLAFSESPLQEGHFVVTNDLPPNPHATYGRDEYFMYSTVQLFGISTTLGIGFDDDEGIALSSNALPQTPPSFEPILFAFTMSTGQRIEGYLTTFTPEPGVATMLILCATTVLARRCRSARR
jgi:hypothetical protein